MSKSARAPPTPRVDRRPFHDGSGRGSRSASTRAARGDRLMSPRASPRPRRSRPPRGGHHTLH
eukprot:209393-Prymnesium_polylepis.2